MRVSVCSSVFQSRSTWEHNIYGRLVPDTVSSPVEAFTIVQTIALWSPNRDSLKFLPASHSLRFLLPFSSFPAMVFDYFGGEMHQTPAFAAKQPAFVHKSISGTTFHNKNILSTSHKARTCCFRPSRPDTVAMRMSVPSVVFVTPNGICADHGRAKFIASEVLEGGVSLIQIRDRLATDEQVVATASALLSAGISASKISVNGVHPNLVQKLSPNLGVHIREEKISDWVQEAKKIMAPDAIISCSVHSVESASKALVGGGPSYLQVGTMYPSTSHPGKIPEGPSLLRDIRKTVGPKQVIIGIGGVKEDNLNAVIENGADGVAVISGISSADDPRAAAANLLRLCQIACSMRS